MGAAPYVLDAPYVGQTYAPPVRNNLGWTEKTIVARLQPAMPSNFRCEAFPGPWEEYPLRNANGAVLLRFSGATYDKPEVMGPVEQMRAMEWRLIVMARNLGWNYGAQGDNDDGAYALLEAIRLTLQGFAPVGFRKAYPRSEKFLAYYQGLWVYEALYVFETWTVEQHVTPNFPPLVKAIAQEEGGQTTRSVAPTQYTFNSQDAIVLPNQNLSNVVVTNVAGTTTYVLGTDYTVDTVDGIITMLSGGAIPPQGTVAVSYDFAEVVTAIAGGGSAPMVPTN